MYNHLDNFLKAIDNKLKVKITFNSKDRGQITRFCIPFDFGPSQKKDSLDRSSKYHVFDLNSPEGRHNLSINPNTVVDIEILEESFEPSEFVKWTPSWIYARDWGIYS